MTGPEPLDRLPRGSRDLLPTAAAERRRAQARLLKTFDRWGFSEVVPPLVEYHDVHRRGLSVEQGARVVRFIEAGTGELVSLRADVTPQIARMVAQRMRPRGSAVRVSYAADILRIPEEQSDRAELHQVGVELIGEGGPRMDAEMVALADASLRSVGLSDFRIELAHTGVFRSALKTIGLSEEDAARIRGPFARKDEVAISAILKEAGVKPRHRTAMFALCRAYGGTTDLEDFRARLRPLRVAAAIDELEEVLDLVEYFNPSLRAGIVLDLGEARGFDYYTGIRLRAWAPDCSAPLIRGGRYDDMVGRYGSAMPAIGFAVDLDALERARAAQRRGGGAPAPRGCLVAVNDVADRARMRRAISLVTEIRRGGTPSWLAAEALDLAAAKTLALTQNAKQLCHLGARLSAWELNDEQWRRTATPGKKVD
ncbi:MAG: ATP phosphoribosyltransferase regulatory subunit [Nannocystaceae bacterium]